MEKTKSAVVLVVDASLAVSLAAALGIISLVDLRSAGLSERMDGIRRESLVGSIYELRTAPDKEKWIATFGGSRETEGAVLAGLDWLVRHQSADGSWSNAGVGPRTSNPDSRCDDGSPCKVPGQDFVMAQTGLALLALQASGNYDFNANTYSTHVGKGLRWLADHQHADGALVGRNPPKNDAFRSTFMYEHAIATFALAEACAVRRALNERPDEGLRDAATRGIAFIEARQHNDGGWRYSTNKAESSDTSVSGWAMLALKSAKEAGLPVQRDTIDRTRDFFASCETRDGRMSYLRGTGQGSDALTGVGMLTHLLLLKETGTPQVKGASSYLASHADTYRDHIRAGRANFYTLYNVTLAMQQAGGPDWETWNGAIRDAVVSIQCQAPGCQRGSWDPSATQGGDIGGRVYSTSLATLMLEVYYRFSRKSVP